MEGPSKCLNYRDLAACSPASNERIGLDTSQSLNRSASACVRLPHNNLKTIHSNQKLLRSNDASLVPPERKG
jgi:hypothetical protein